MNKFKLLLITLLLVFPTKIFALTGSIDVNCSVASSSPGSSVTCVLTGTSDEPISAISIPFAVSNATITNITMADTWTFPVDINSGQITQSTSSTNVQGEFGIGTFTLKINDGATDNASLSFNDILFTDLSGTTHSVGSKSVTLAITTPKGLTNIEATGGVLGPPFSLTNYSYTLMLSAETTNFSLTLTQANSSDAINVFDIDSQAALNISNITFQPSGGNSSMSIMINVGEGNRLVSYTILVARETAPNVGMPTISSITVGGQTVQVADQMSVSLDDVSNYQVVANLSDSTNYSFDTSAFGSTCSASSGVLTCRFNNPGTYSINVVANEAGGASKTYILDVSKKASSESGTIADSGSTTPPPPAPANTSDNPRTGGFAVSFVALMLVVSLGLSVYLYRKNMQNFNN